MRTSLNAILFTLILGLYACGLVKKGGVSATYNDPVPNGTIVAQGDFTGLNGRTVSGIATVYRLNSGSGFVARLEGLTVSPQQSPLILIVNDSSETVLTTQLKGLSGNQNYYISSTEDRTWTSATVKSSTDPNNPEFGTALFQN